MEIIIQCLLLYYGEDKKENEENKLTSKAKKRKVEEECLEGNLNKLTVQNPSTSDEMGSSQEYSSQSSKSSKLDLETNQEHMEEIDTEKVLRNDREVDNSFVQYCLENNLEEKGSKENSTFLPTSKYFENNIQSKNGPDDFIFLDDSYQEKSCNALEIKVSCPNKTAVSTMTINETIKPFNTIRPYYGKSVEETDCIQMINLAENKQNLKENNEQEVKYRKEELPISSDEISDKEETPRNGYLSTSSRNEMQKDEVILSVNDVYVEPEFHKKSDFFMQREKDEVSDLAGICLPTLSQWSRGDISLQTKRRSDDCDEVIC